MGRPGQRTGKKRGTHEEGGTESIRVPGYPSTAQKMLLQKPSTVHEVPLNTAKCSCGSRLHRGHFIHSVLLHGTLYIPAEFNIYDNLSASLKTLYLTVG